MRIIYHLLSPEYSRKPKLLRSEVWARALCGELEDALYVVVARSVSGSVLAQPTTAACGTREKVEPGTWHLRTYIN
jgi:hypothetical protein